MVHVIFMQHHWRRSLLSNADDRGPLGGGGRRRFVGAAHSLEAPALLI